VSGPTRTLCVNTQCTSARQRDRVRRNGRTSLRLTKIEFSGYKRLLSTRCNVDSKMVAFVGPNEAGKSSILEALAWLHEGGELGHDVINRTLAPASVQEVAATTFILDDADLALLNGIDAETLPTTLRFARSKDGQGLYRWGPQRLSRPTGARETAAAALDAARGDINEDLPDLLKADVERLRDLAESAVEWTEDDHTRAARFASWLEVEVQPKTAEDEDGREIVLPPTRDKKATKRLTVAASSLRDWERQMGLPAPEDAAWDALSDRVPAFLMFREEDRVLHDEYSLAFTHVNQGGQNREVPNEDVTDPPAALESLLKVGGTTMQELYDLVRAGDNARKRTKEREVNRRLEAAISPYWQQRPLDVNIDLDGSLLRIYINEPDDVSTFTQRSDGVRTFIALIAFLAKHKTEVPPVLLIDEAETHLHFDAQADLISFLPTLAGKTLYSTHSPGCLPTDLGRGVRLVEPTRPMVSELRNDFWTASEQVGFMPLLFAMGAGAAAFSRFRAAVFTEGPADMILLPKLLTEANDVSALGYQVVPGLSNLPPERLHEADYAAARVAYLLDGDAGGDNLRAHLRDAGIPGDRVFALRAGWAVEDLVDPDHYLKAVNTVLADAGKTIRVQRADVDSQTSVGVPISKAVTDHLGSDTPGKTIVASRLVENDEPTPLADGAEAALRDLHRSFVALLDLT